MPPFSEDPTSAATESAPLAPAAAESEAPSAEIPGGSSGEAASGETRDRVPRRRRRRRRKPAPAGANPAPAAGNAEAGEAVAEGEAAAPAASDAASPPAIRPRRRRRRHRPRPNPNPPARLLGIAEAGLEENTATGETASEGGAVPAAAEGAAGRLRVRLRRPRAPRPLGSAVDSAAPEASAAPVAGEDAPPGPAPRPRRRRRKPAAASLAAPPAEALQNGREDTAQPGAAERETGRRPHRGDPARRSRQYGEGERGPRENGRAGPRGDRRRGPQDRFRGEGRGRSRPEPERRLYALEAVVDRGFEDVEEDGETRRIPWTIIKRTVADQKSGRQMSAVYVLQRDGAEEEFPNLGAARGAAHKTIVHPEKLTLSKAEHAAARGGGDGKKGR